VSAFTQSPRLIKGAIITVSPLNPAAVIIFQYNPAELVRSLTPQREKAERVPVGTQRLTGPPREKIDMTIMVNAVDQLEQGGQSAAALGVYPQLSALEMLLYPARSLVLANTAKLAMGVLAITPPEAPLTVLVFGTKRVVPMQLVGYTATETLHTPDLVPINASAKLSIEVLTYQDFQPTQPGYYLSLANQAVREVMAAIGTIGNIKAVADGALQLV
jgi:hypothetical protein